MVHIERMMFDEHAAEIIHSNAAMSDRSNPGMIDRARSAALNLNALRRIAATIRQHFERWEFGEVQRTISTLQVDAFRATAPGIVAGFLTTAARPRWSGAEKGCGSNSAICAESYL